MQEILKFIAYESFEFIDAMIPVISSIMLTLAGWLLRHWSK